MKSIDYIKAYLDNRGINYHVQAPMDINHWKWVIRTDENVDIYMIHNSRFLIMGLDVFHTITFIEAYIKSKYEVVERLKELLFGGK